jgi:hypothetical protein
MKKMDFFRAHGTGTENMKSIESIKFNSTFSPELFRL